MTIQTSITQEIQLTTHDGTPMVSSLMVAEKFGKLHKDVLRALENLKADCPEDFRQRNFAPTFPALPMGLVG